MPIVKPARGYGWYPNAGKRYEGDYRNDRLTGPWRLWHPNGQLLAEGDYEDGQRTGPWRFQGPDGHELDPAVGGALADALLMSRIPTSCLLAGIELADPTCGRLRQPGVWP